MARAPSTRASATTKAGSEVQNDSERMERLFTNNMAFGDLSHQNTGKKIFPVVCIYEEGLFEINWNFLDNCGNCLRKCRSHPSVNMTRMSSTTGRQIIPKGEVIISFKLNMAIFHVNFGIV